jgi:hypothetical protein
MIEELSLYFLNASMIDDNFIVLKLNQLAMYFIQNVKQLIFAIE